MYGWLNCPLPFHWPIAELNHNRADLDGSSRSVHKASVLCRNLVGRLQHVYPERGGDGVWECIEVLGGSDLALPPTFHTKALVKPVGEQKQNRLGGSPPTKDEP